MSPTNILTMDVVEHIMRYVITDEPGSLKEWKGCLPYLAVDQVWRDATKPMFYTHGIIKFYEAQRNVVRSYYNEPRQGILMNTSNIELIRSSNTRQIVSKLTIDVNCNVSWGNIINTLHNALMSGNNVWNGVTSLNMRIGTHTINLSQAPTAAEIMVILRGLPNISRIFFTNTGNYDKSNWVSDKIINYYMNQLAHLYVSHSVSFLGMNHTAQLTSINVSVGSAVTHRLPYICSDTLQLLHLFNIPHDFSWIYFQKNTASCIDFPQLKTLGLVFMDDAVNSYDSLWIDQPTDTHCVYTLNLPCVESITIRACPPNLKLVQPDDSTSLKKFVFEGSVATLAKCCHVQFGSAQNIDARISVKSEFDDDVPFYEMTNKMFNNEAPLKAARLSIGSVGFELRPQLTEWTHLKSLTLELPIGFTPLLRLIYRLPNLVELKVHNLEENTISDANLRAAHDYRLWMILQRPLTTKIEQLGLGFKAALSTGEAGAILQTLMIQIASLSTLTVHNAYANIANGCKAMLPYQFKHVSNITIELFK